MSKKYVLSCSIRIESFSKMYDGWRIDSTIELKRAILSLNQLHKKFQSSFFHLYSKERVTMTPVALKSLPLSFSNPSSSSFNAVYRKNSEKEKKKKTNIEMSKHFLFTSNWPRIGLRKTLILIGLDRVHVCYMKVSKLYFAWLIA